MRGNLKYLMRVNPDFIYVYPDFGRLQNRIKSHSLQKHKVSAGCNSIDGGVKMLILYFHQFILNSK